MTDPARDWTVEVTLRFPTFATEDQARKRGEHCAELLGVQLHRKVEVVDLHVHPDDDAFDPIENFVPWTGTIAYERVETTDGRVVQWLSWPKLAEGPLPMRLLGTENRFVSSVGTITEVWREALGPNDGPVLEDGTPLPVVVDDSSGDSSDGPTRVRARGTVLRSALRGAARLECGVDVETSGSTEDVRYEDDKFILDKAFLRGLTLYPADGEQRPAWPGCAIEVEEADGG